MKTALLRFGLLCGVMVAAASGCGSSSSGGGNLAESCDKACAVAATLKCKNDDPATCSTKCQQEANAAPKCTAQFEAVAKCGASRPASDWTCDPDDGTSQLKEGVCNAEAEAAIVCVAGPPHD